MAALGHLQCQLSCLTCLCVSRLGRGPGTVPVPCCYHSTAVNPGPCQDPILPISWTVRRQNPSAAASRAGSAREGSRACPAPCSAASSPFTAPQHLPCPPPGQHTAGCRLSLLPVVSSGAPSPSATQAWAPARGEGWDSSTPSPVFPQTAGQDHSLSLGLLLTPSSDSAPHHHHPPFYLSLHFSLFTLFLPCPHSDSFHLPLHFSAGNMADSLCSGAVSPGYAPGRQETRSEGSAPAYQRAWV